MKGLCKECGEVKELSKVGLCKGCTSWLNHFYLYDKYKEDT